MIKTITKYYCDRCGKEMEKTFTFYYDTQPQTVIKVQRNEWEFADLCSKCKESFKAWWEKSSTSTTGVEGSDKK